MKVKELIEFLSKLNPNAKVTITKTVFVDGISEFDEAYDEDITEELYDYNLSVDALNGDNVDIRFL